VFESNAFFPSSPSLVPLINSGLVGESPKWHKILGMSSSAKEFRSDGMYGQLGSIARDYMKFAQLVGYPPSDSKVGGGVLGLYLYFFLHMIF
jgi:hypothetical protein